MRFIVSSSLIFKNSVNVGFKITAYFTAVTLKYVED